LQSKNLTRFCTQAQVFARKQQTTKASFERLNVKILQHFANVRFLCGICRIFAGANKRKEGTNKDAECF
jgi:hypothetical protein